ncbi:hypothetical protein CIK64_15335 [Brevibacterium aurantiacum]|uniref:HTH marR-type domain-containing protein n=2 Tax=Brevibacterium aurantiacum TaxID=273384 RepID=A0A2A3Z1N3_BREAU|nr:hypothetical protein CIK64_15335 [Brevibacterium aurantiacum]
MVSDNRADAEETNTRIDALAASNQKTTGDTSKAGQELDYWSFVKLTRLRLGDQFDLEHLQANQAVLSLNRAAGAITYDLESIIHRPRLGSWAAYTLLFVLWNAGPMPSHRLAELSNMSRAAVSNMTKTLLTRGYIEKKPHSRDGRAITLHLTESGTVAIEESFAKEVVREREWMSALTDIEQQLLIQLLDKLISSRNRSGLTSRN